LKNFCSDDPRIATTPDATTFKDAMKIDPATEIVNQPHLPRFSATTNYDNNLFADAWTTTGINMG